MSLLMPTGSSSSLGRPQSWLRVLTARVDRAVSLGPVELVCLAEFHFRDHPNRLRVIRRSYTDFCLSLLMKLEDSESGPEACT
jgi:hypothetical protein